MEDPKHLEKQKSIYPLKSIRDLPDFGKGICIIHSKINPEKFIYIPDKDHVAGFTYEDYMARSEGKVRDTSGLSSPH